MYIYGDDRIIFRTTAIPNAIWGGNTKRNEVVIMIRYVYIHTPVLYEQPGVFFYEQKMFRYTQHFKLYVTNGVSKFYPMFKKKKLFMGAD